jgi:hypothetical protein
MADETLAQRVRAKYPGAYDDMTDQQLESAVKSKFPGVYDDLPTTPEQGAAPEKSWTDNLTLDNLKKAAYNASPLPLFERKNLPMTGAVLATAASGGAAAPAIALAGLGGAVGETVGQISDTLQSGKGKPAAETAREIMTQGAIQGGIEGLGRGVAGAARVAGKALIENAVRPPISMQREFPNVVEDIVKRRLPVGAGRPGGKTGSARATELLMDESRNVTQHLARETAFGVKYQPAQLLDKVSKLVDEISEQPLSAADMDGLKGMVEEFAQRGPITPLELQKLKQKAQAFARPIYKAIERGMPVTADQSLRARFNASIAGAAKELMETIPGVAKGEAEKKALIGVKRALTQAEQRRLSLMAEGVTGAAGIVGALMSQDGGLDDTLKRGVGAYLVTRGLMSPRGMSRGGLVLTAPQLKQLFTQFPRLAQAVLANSDQTEAAPQATAPQ